MFSLESGSVSKASVHELLSFYKRQKTELRNDGMRLIRPVARPDYIINNNDVRLTDVLGKVKLTVHRPNLIHCVTLIP